MRSVTVFAAIDFKNCAPAASWADVDREKDGFIAFFSTSLLNKSGTDFILSVSAVDRRRGDRIFTERRHSPKMW
jgi:hypothetical protein